MQCILVCMYVLLYSIINFFSKAIRRVKVKIWKVEILFSKEEISISLDLVS